MKNSIVLCALVSLCGCSTYPKLPNNPPTLSGETYALKLEKSGIPFAGVSSLEDATLKLAQYYKLYNDEAAKKRRNNFAADEAGFLMGTAGVLGGIGKSIEIAAAGALGAAGASVYSDRYRLQVQAANYELAAKSLRCMYFLAEDIQPVYATRRNDRFTDNGAIVGPDVLVTIRQNFLKVHERLQSLQNSFQLGQPDLSKLTAAASKRGVDNESKSMPQQDKDEAASLGTFKAEMEKCAAIITG
jgi:hypothetical protein